MIEKIGHIKNPLSVIAIFAAIAEISGTTVLPFIEANNQSIYIWFLMFFPVFLVGSFFLTLNFNHRVLYAPSDYKDEKHFVSSFTKARPDEQSVKLHGEVEEIEAEGDSEESSGNLTASGITNIIPASRVVRDKKREIMADVVLAEKLAVNNLEKNLGMDFKTNIKFKLSPTSEDTNIPGVKMRMGIIFDAVHLSDKAVHAVEVKLFKKRTIDPERFAGVIKTSELVANQCEDVSSKSLTLHVFAVTDNPEVETDILRRELEKSLISSVINIVVHVATLSDLQNEYQYSA